MRKILAVLFIALIVFGSTACTNYNYDYLYWWMAQQEEENKPTAEEAAVMGGAYIDAFDMDGISNVGSGLFNGLKLGLGGMVFGGESGEYADLAIDAAETAMEGSSTDNVSDFIGKQLAYAVAGLYGNLDKGYIAELIDNYVEAGVLGEVVVSESGAYTLSVDDIEMTIPSEFDTRADYLEHILSGVLEEHYTDENRPSDLPYNDSSQFPFEAPVTITATLSIADLDSGLFSAESGCSCKGSFIITIDGVLYNTMEHGDVYLTIGDVSVSTDGPLTMVGADGVPHDVSVDDAAATLGWTYGEVYGGIDFNVKFIKEILGGTITIDGRTIDFVDAVLESADASAVLG